MPMKTWPFAVLRLGLIVVIYFSFRPQPLFLLPLGLIVLLGVHRYWCFALGAALFGLFFYSTQLPNFYHDHYKHFLVAMVTFFLGFSPCDRDFALRPMWNKKGWGEFKADPAFMWNIYKLMVFAIYLKSAIGKMSLHFLEGRAITSVLVDRYLFHSDIVLSPWFAAAGIVAGSLALILNVFFCIAVWVPRFYFPFVILASIYHVSFLLLNGGPGPAAAHLLFLLLLIPFMSKVSTST